MFVFQGKGAIGGISVVEGIEGNASLVRTTAKVSTCQERKCFRQRVAAYLGGGGDEILLGCRPSTGVCLPLLTIVLSGTGWLSEPLDCADLLRGGSFPMKEILRLSDRKLVVLSVDNEFSLLPGRLRIGVETSGDVVVGDVILAKGEVAYHRTESEVIQMSCCRIMSVEMKTRAENRSSRV